MSSFSCPRSVERAINLLEERNDFPFDRLAVGRRRGQIDPAREG